MVAAAVKQFRMETVAGFEQTVSMLRATCTREAVIKGNQATFLVASSGSQDATTRGDNGDIPYDTPTNSQKTATLVEKHGTHEETGFNMFASQGDQFAIMQKGSMAKINRDIDNTILSELANATQSLGDPATGSVELVARAQAVIGNADADIEDEDNLFFVITPAFRAYLIQTSEFSNGDYVETKTFNGAARKVWRWAGFNWIVSTAITRQAGYSAADEACYAFHRDAIGHAVNIGEENIDADYESKHDRSWSRVTVYHGAKLLQNTGIVKVRHNGAAMVAAT